MNHRIHRPVEANQMLPLIARIAKDLAADVRYTQCAVFTLATSAPTSTYASLSAAAGEALIRIDRYAEERLGVPAPGSGRRLALPQAVLDPPLHVDGAGTLPGQLRGR